MRFCCLVTFVLLSATVRAQDTLECKPVEGHLTESVTNPNPLQTSGPVIGVLSGTYDFTLKTLASASADTPSVSLFIAASVIHAQAGDLKIAEAGAVDGATGNLSVLWTVVGGTREWTDASGQIFVFGNFNFSTGLGAATYRGEVCTP